MDLLYINAMDIENLNLTNEEILGAVEKSLEAQGNGKTVIEPRVHLIPNPEYHGHFVMREDILSPWMWQA